MGSGQQGIAWRAVKCFTSAGVRAGPYAIASTDKRFFITKTFDKGVPGYVLWDGRTRHPKSGLSPTSDPLKRLANQLSEGRLNDDTAQGT